MQRPKKVLHLLNSAGGGAALSTLSIVRGLAAEGIGSCAVCHDTGTAEERRAIDEAFRGEVLYSRLYWWNRKTRMPLWRRPLAEARQLIVTGASIVSAGGSTGSGASRAPTMTRCERSG